MILANPVHCITDHPGFEALCLKCVGTPNCLFSIQVGVWNKDNSINYKEARFNMIYELIDYI